MPILNAFRKRYSIDKMNTIFLTDVQVINNDRYIAFNPSEEEKEKNYMTRTVDKYYIKNTDYQNNLVLRDPKTKKEYMCE